MKEWALALSLLAATVGVLSALALQRGGEAKSWEIQSWDGSSDVEKAFEARGRRWRAWGLFALGLAFILSAAAALVSYYA